MEDIRKFQNLKVWFADGPQIIFIYLFIFWTEYVYVYSPQPQSAQKIKDQKTCCYSMSLMSVFKSV